MININFDNPYLLLLAIPLLLLVIIPIAIVIKRDNRSKSVIASVVMHVVMVLCVSFAVAGTEITAVVTETNVYVLADVSYSSHANLNTVDSYVRQVEKQLPLNSKMGVICFGKDYEVNTELGGKFKTVTANSVDDSATNIASVLDYAGTLFGEGVIKRVVLITDGKETNADTTDLVNSITNLYNAGVKIDVMYLDNNAGADVKEIQLSGVEYAKATFSNAETNEASVLVQSSVRTQGYVTLYDGETEVKRVPKTFEPGYNIINIDLKEYSDDFAEGETSIVKNYLVKVETEGDTSAYNNEYTFTQKVEKKLKVLVLTESKEDIEKYKELYKGITNDGTEDDPNDGLTIKYLANVQAQKEVPTSVEELSKYDQIVLSNVNVTKAQNYDAFLDSLNKVVSNFGKSLITVGDVHVQNDAAGDLAILDSMVPVQFGKNDTEKKLLGIIIDVSRSMYQADRLTMAKRAAKQLINLLGPTDEFTLIAFSGTSRIVIQPTAIKDEEHKKELFETIDGLQPVQGTYIGDAMNNMYEIIKSKQLIYSERQVMLISDGLNYTGEVEFQPERIASKLFGEFDTPTSTINVFPTSETAVNCLSTLSSYGIGSYYEVKNIADLDKLLLEVIAPDITDTEVKESSAVHVVKGKDKVLQNIATDGELAFENVNYYVNSQPKQSATTVLTVDYTRPSGSVVQSPLYAYWNYGNGRVATFTSVIAGTTPLTFMDAAGSALIDNMISVNVPETRVDYPYTLNVDYDGLKLNIEVIPVAIDPNAQMEITLTSPDGEAETQTLYFTTTNFYGSFDCIDVGKYTIDLKYTYNSVTTETQTYYDLAYSNEYNSFTAYDSAVLFSSVRNMGTVTEDGTVSLKNDDSEVETYTINGTLPLMIATVVLYVVDIAVRKLKKEDILSLFGKKSKDKEGK